MSRDRSGDERRRRERRHGLSWRAGILLAAAVLAAPAYASAQEAGCALEGRAGLAVPSAGHGADLEADLGIALGAACPVADRLRLGGTIASEQLDRYGFLRLEATADLRLARLGDPGTRLELRGVAALARGGQLGVRLAALPESFTQLEDGAWGPSFGTSLRLRAPLDGSLALVVDAGWRVAWVDRIRFRRFEPVARTAEAIHWFPLTAGLVLSL